MVKLLLYNKRNIPLNDKSLEGISEDRSKVKVISNRKVSEKNNKRVVR